MLTRIIKNRLAAFERLLAQAGCRAEACSFMGDDLPDLPVLRRCAIAVAPPHAHIEVRQSARYVTQAAAGHGAAREFCDLLLVASGHYAELLEAYR